MNSSNPVNTVPNGHSEEILLPIPGGRNSDGETRIVVPKNTYRQKEVFQLAWVVRQHLANFSKNDNRIDVLYAMEAVNRSRRPINNAKRSTIWKNITCKAHFLNRIYEASQGNAFNNFVNPPEFDGAYKDFKRLMIANGLVTITAENVNTFIHDLLLNNVFLQTNVNNVNPFIALDDPVATQNLAILSEAASAVEGSPSSAANGGDDMQTMAAGQQTVLNDTDDNGTVSNLSNILQNREMYRTNNVTVTNSNVTVTNSAPANIVHNINANGDSDNNANAGAHIAPTIDGNNIAPSITNANSDLANRDRNIELARNVANLLQQNDTTISNALDIDNVDRLIERNIRAGTGIQLRDGVDSARVNNAPRNTNTAAVTVHSTVNARNEIVAAVSHPDFVALLASLSNAQRTSLLSVFDSFAIEVLDNVAKCNTAFGAFTHVDRRSASYVTFMNSVRAISDSVNSGIQVASLKIAALNAPHRERNVPVAAPVADVPIANGVVTDGTEIAEVLRLRQLVVEAEERRRRLRVASRQQVNGFRDGRFRYVNPVMGGVSSTTRDVDDNDAFAQHSDDGAGGSDELVAVESVAVNRLQQGAANITGADSEVRQSQVTDSEDNSNANSAIANSNVNDRNHGTSSVNAASSGSSRATRSRGERLNNFYVASIIKSANVSRETVNRYLLALGINSVHMYWCDGDYDDKRVIMFKTKQRQIKEKIVALIRGDLNGVSMADDYGSVIPDIGIISRRLCARIRESSIIVYSALSNDSSLLQQIEQDISSLHRISTNGLQFFNKSHLNGVRGNSVCFIDCVSPSTRNFIFNKLEHNEYPGQDMSIRYALGNNARCFNRYFQLPVAELRRSLALAPPDLQVLARSIKVELLAMGIVVNHVVPVVNHTVPYIMITIPLNQKKVVWQRSRLILQKMVDLLNR